MPNKPNNSNTPPTADCHPRLVLPLWEWVKWEEPGEVWVAKADESTQYMVIRQRKEWLSRVCYGTRYKRIVSVWDNPHHTEPSIEDAKLQCAHHYLQNKPFARIVSA